MPYPTLGGIDPRGLDRWRLPSRAAKSSLVSAIAPASIIGGPPATPAVSEPTAATPAATPTTPPATEAAPAYGTGYYTPPAGTPPGFTPEAAPTMPPMVAPTSGISYAYENGNWRATNEGEAYARWFGYWLQNHPPGPGGIDTNRAKEDWERAKANDQMWLERAREDWMGQRLEQVRFDPSTQARAGQLQEQGRRELYGRAFEEAGKYGEAMGSRGLGESAVAGMVQGDIMQSAAEAKVDADLAALNQAIAEGQNLIFGTEQIRNPTTAALLSDALDARAFERRAALQRELAPDDTLATLGSLAGIAGGSFLGPLGSMAGAAVGRLAGGRGNLDLTGTEWDPNRVPKEW